MVQLTTPTPLHDDARAYLRAWLATPPHSYGFLARRSGLSRPHLANLVSGTRRITRQSAERIVDGLRLSEPEAAYFLALAAASDGRTEGERDEARAALPELRRRLRASGPSPSWTPEPAERVRLSLPPEQMAGILAEVRDLQQRIHRLARATPAPDAVVRTVQVGVSSPAAE